MGREEAEAAARLDRRAAALLRNERPDALDAAREALRRCRLLRPAPPLLEARIRGRLGGIHAARHEWREAVDAHRAALVAQGRLRHVGLLARMHGDLSAAHLGLGDGERAVAHARRSLALQEMLGGPAGLARAERTLGVALLRQGHLDAAGEWLRRSLARHPERGRGRLLLALSEHRSRRGDAGGAERLAEAAAGLALRLDEGMTLAAARQRLGWLRAGRDDHAGADDAFGAALAYLAGAGLAERLAECHAQYAHALEARGDLAAAVGHWRRAVGAVRPSAAP